MTRGWVPTRARTRARARRMCSGRRAGCPASGMTLVELLMALVVLSIGILGVAGLFPLGRAASTDGRLLTQATDLAQQTMEQLRTKGFHDPALADGTHPNGTGEWVGTNGRFYRWWTVTQLTGALSDVKLVDVRVTWTAVRPDTVRLVTYFKR